VNDRTIPAADRALPVAIAHMIRAVIGKPFRTILRVFIILLLLAIVVLYVLVVLLGKRRPSGRDVLAADRRLDRRLDLPAVNRSSTMPQHYVPGMDETQSLAAQALREPPALSDIFARQDGGSARSARPRLTHAIMADRAVVAAAEIATLRQKLAAAEARIRETGRHNATEAERFRAICQRIDDSVGIMTHTGHWHQALNDKDRGGVPRKTLNSKKSTSKKGRPLTTLTRPG
jgi:hypothetical protein